MYETEKQRKVREARERNLARRIAAQEEVSIMYQTYEQYLANGCTRASAITQTAADTGIARSTVFYRVEARYGKADATPQVVNG